MNCLIVCVCVCVLLNSFCVFVQCLLYLSLMHVITPTLHTHTYKHTTMCLTTLSPHVTDSANNLSVTSHNFSEHTDRQWTVWTLMILTVQTSIRSLDTDVSRTNMLLTQLRTYTNLSSPVVWLVQPVFFLTTVSAW